MPLNSTFASGSRRGFSGGKKAIPLPGTVGNFAQRLASLPEYLATANQSATLSPSTLSSWGYSGFNNTLYYTTIYCTGDSRHYNAIMLQSQRGNSVGAAENSRGNSTGHNAGGMIPLSSSPSGYSSSEAWVGTSDAEKLLFIDSSAYRTVMGIVGSNYGDGNGTELYFQRNAGVGASTIFNRITETEGTDWSQNNSTKSLLRAMNGTGYRTNKANGPWGSGHYGPWGWDTSDSTPANSELLEYALYGTYGSVSVESIYIFERDDNFSYPPGRTKSMFVFYPDYPAAPYT